MVQQFIDPGPRWITPFVGVPVLPKHPIIGRDQALVELRSKLFNAESKVALSALNGLPGVGKTTLALTLAYDKATRDYFRGGIFWAGLGPKADVDSALNRWATALNADISEARDPEAKAVRLSLILQRNAQGTPILLIVDDVWEERDAQPFWSIALPGCARLLTTRYAQIGRRFADRVTSVEVLSDEDAERFLEERCPEARAADPEGFKELVRAIGGLPLGLNLIAGELNAKVGQPRRIRKAIERLKATEARLALEDKERGRPGWEGVSMTMRAIIDQSIEALNPTLQQAFTSLGAFTPKPADFSLDAAAAVLGMDEAESDEVMYELTNRGLVENAGEDRYTLHQVMADVAELRSNGQTAPMARHATFYLEFVDNDRENWRQIEREMDQIRKGLAWVSTLAEQHPEGILAYTHALRAFLKNRGLWEEYLNTANLGLQAACAMQRPTDELEMLNSLGSAYLDLGDPAKAHQTLLSALNIARATGNKSKEAFTLNNIARYHSLTGEKTLALNFYKKALDIRKHAQNHRGAAITINNMGAVHSKLGNKKLALSLYGESLDTQRKIGDIGGQSLTLANIGKIHIDLYEPQHAIRPLEESLALARESGSRSREALALNNLGHAYIEMGETDRALNLLDQALKIRHEINSYHGATLTLKNIGLTYLNTGNPAFALLKFEEALALARRTRNLADEGVVLYTRGLAYTAQGNLDRALEAYTQALTIHSQIGQRFEEAETLYQLAKLHAQTGSFPKAISLMEQVVTIDEEIERPTLAEDRAFLEDLRNGKIDEAPANAAHEHRTPEAPSPPVVTMLQPAPPPGPIIDAPEPGHAKSPAGAAPKLTELPTLRRLLDHLLRDDSDFSAFCIDYFGNIHKRLTSGMDRVQKVNILFIHAEPEQILAALLHRHADAVAAFEHELAVKTPPRAGD